MNFIKLKKIFIYVLAAPAIFLLIANFILFLNKPNIVKIDSPDMRDFVFDSVVESSPKLPSKDIQTSSFDYELIGYRSGIMDSSVILKKGNKEYVVAKGDKIDGIYELIEVNTDEVIFSNNGNIYKIENLVGK
mgnify:FL=1|tara:strand:- start:1437 stop:1835 length:399 start_codon:yes stop_codon:yes gene_type:complete